MERQNYKVEVYKTDARYTEGERINQVIQLENETEAWANWYADMLRKCLTEGKYRVVLKPANAFVKSLMTGKMVKIREEDRGGVCDPSQERFWSM